MMQTETIKLTCPDCKSEFDARSIKIFESVVVLRQYCPACTKKRRQVEEAMEQAEQQKVIAAKRLKWRQTCGIPQKFINEEFGTFKTDQPGNIKKVYKACLDYAEGFNLLNPQGYKSLVLLSPNQWGVGKSHLACSICHYILNRWNGENIACPVFFTTEPDLLMRIRATFNKGQFNDNGAWWETEDSIIAQMITVKLLVLDDVGKEEVADPRFVQRTLFKIINGRYNNNLPMIITANKTAGELKDYLGGRIVTKDFEYPPNEASFNRLVEMADFFQVNGESYRVKKKAG